MTTHSTRRRLLGRLGACSAGAVIAPLGALIGAGTAAPAARAQSEESALARIRRLGRLSVGLYHDLPPFHVKGEGIEVHLATALARQLGVALSLLPFNADENMNDDLRNMVWRGHYLGYGPADVLLHVPVDRPLMQSNPRVSIFAPYWRERVMIARDLSKVPNWKVWTRWWAGRSRWPACRWRAG